MWRPLGTKAVSSFINAVKEKYDVKSYQFDSESKPSQTFDFKGKETDISKLFLDLENNYANKNIGAIILATDGEFPVSEEIRESIEKFSKEDIFLTVFNFGKQNNASKNLKKLSDLGKGNYTYINKTNAELTLIREAKSKRSK